MRLHTVTRSCLLAALLLAFGACGSDDSPSSNSDAGDAAAPTTEATPTSASPAEGSTTTPSATTPAATPATTPTAPFSVPQVTASGADVTVSGLSAALGGVVSGLPEPLVDLQDLRSGGPPPDGIPSIDTPRFLKASDVGFLGDREPVLALEIGGEARAYPVQILMWHEIVNDTVADVPVAVTYCPLCNSALAYDRRIDGQVLEFGTSGLLWNSSLVMYDRQTETLWSHFTGQAIVGELTGVELETFPVATVPWALWRDAHPDSLVLSRDTGFDRDYGRNPYPGYDDVDGDPFLFEGEVDGRYTAMTRLVGLERDGAALAVPLTVLEQDGVVSADLAGTPLVFFWQPGTASPLDAPTPLDGDEIGATGVFVASVDGQQLTFRSDADGFVDDETGTRWNLLGQALAGPLTGQRLEPVAHVDTFWFAWATFRPDTAILTS